MHQDFIHAFRTFRRNKFLTAAAIICLALGTGATTAVFSVMNAVLFERLPYPNAERLVALRPMDREDSAGQGRVSEAELRDWQETAASFDSIAGYRWMTMDLIEGTSSERLQGLWVTSQFFSIFGIQPKGRSFASGELAGLVLGHRLWAQRFASDETIIGKPVSLGICCPQQPRTTKIAIAGVVPYDVPFPPTLPGIRDRGHGLNDIVDYWAPLNVNRARRPGSRNVEVVAKLKPNVSVAQAQAEMTSIASRMAQSFPDTNRGWTVHVAPIADELFAQVRPTLYLLMMAAAFLLLIACGNVAVLLTFDAVRRFHEFAVRAAVGASAGRLVRQFVTESVCLTALGGLGGLLVATSAKRVVVGLAPSNLPRLANVSLDARVLGFAVASTIVCGILVGLIPALRFMTSNLESALRADNSRALTSSTRANIYKPLLTFQVALTLALLIGSGLILKSLHQLMSISPGFQTANVITTTISLPSAKHAWSYNSQFSDLVLQRIRMIPGVEAASAIRGIPMSEVVFDSRLSRSDRSDVEKGPLVRLRIVSRDYFKSMGIHVLAGRDFEAHDEAGKVGVATAVIMNEKLAKLFWPNQSAVGQKVLGNDIGNTAAEVIGVVNDVRYTGLDKDPLPEVYLPQNLFPQDEMTLIIHTASNPGRQLEHIRQAIYEVQRDVFIAPFQTTDAVIANSIANRRFAMMLMTAFTVIALLLAVAGVGGIVAYSLSSRVREIGIRLALGANSRQVIALVSRQGLIPAFAGLLLGLLLAFGLTRFLRNMLYQVSPYDPVVFVVATAALGFVSTVVAVISAYRACRVQACDILK